jgi:hypothetical protein
MKAARCAPALCGGKPNDLAADTASHRLNFLAARLNGTESPPKRPAIRRMSGKSAGLFLISGWFGQFCQATAGSLTNESSLNGAMVSRVM